jgi:hypothetical protein
MQAQLYVSPAELPVAAWLRHFVALIFTALLPGYLLLRTLDPGRHIGTLETFLLSYLLSVFLTFLVGYLALLVGLRIAQVSIYCVAFLNSVLFAAFACRSHRRLDNNDNPEAIRNVKKIELWNILFFIGIVGLLIFFTYGLIGTQIIADQRTIHGLGLVMEQISLPKDRVAFPSYPWLMVTYVAMMFATSGLPSVNAYNSLNMMNVFAVLAFFIMVRRFFRKWPNNDVIAAVSTLIAFFTSGFGWIVALGSTTSGASSSLAQYVYQAWTQTYDLLTSNSYVASGHPNVTTSLLFVALPAVLLAFGIAISDDKSISARLRLLLLALLIAISYLGHPETVPILGLLLVVSLFLKNGLWNLLSGVLGIAAIIVVDLSSPSHFYLSSYASLLGFRAPLLLLLLSGFIIALAISVAMRVIKSLALMVAHAVSKMSSRVLALFGRVSVRLSFFLAATYLYLLGFVFWVLQLNAAVVPYYFSLDGSVPWYFYPIRLGIPGLVTIVGSVHWMITGRFKELKILLPLYAWMLITLFASPFYLDYRLIKQFYLPVSITSAFVLIGLIENQHSTLPKVKIGHTFLPKMLKASLAVLLTSLVVLASIGSPLLYAYVVQHPDNSQVPGILPRYAPLTAGELEALDWIRNNTESGSIPVIGLSSYLGNNIADIAGVWEVLANRYVPFFQVSDAANLFDLIGMIQPRYMYISQSDLRVLQAEGYSTSVAVELAKYLPIAFSNSVATAYEVPPLVGPSLESSVAVPESSSMFSLAMLGLAEVNYTVFSKVDPALFNHITIILSDCPTMNSDLAQYEDWAKNGGHLLILDLPPDFKLPVGDLLIDGISTENLTIKLPNLYVSQFNQTTLSDENLSIGSYYALGGKQIAPFSLVRSIGLGDVTYINFEPLVGFLSGTDDQLAQRLLFMTLGSILNAIAPTLPRINRSALNLMEPIPYVQGEINCTGSAIVETDSILFSSCMSPVSTLVQIDLSGAMVSSITENRTAVLQGGYKLQGDLLAYDENGTVTTYVHAPWLVLNNTCSGVYPQIDLSSESAWESVISSNSHLNLTLRVDGNPVLVVISGGSVEGHFIDSSDGDNESDFSSCTTIYARYPSLQLQGQTYIENAFLSTSPNKVIALGDSVVVSGSIGFRIVSVDQTTVRIANLSLLGTISHVENQNKGGVGLLEALISPYNLLVAASAMVVTFVAFRRPQYHRVIRRVRIRWKIVQTS